MSCCSAICEISKGDTPEEVLPKADTASYAAKVTGRNKAMLHREDEPPVMWQRPADGHG